MTYAVHVMPNHKGPPLTDLVIFDGDTQRVYSDNGEPEDNSFAGDYQWIRRELLSAYERGKVDGLEELRAQFQALNSALSPGRETRILDIDPTEGM